MKAHGPTPDVTIVQAYFEAVRKGARKGLSVRTNPVEFLARDAFNQPVLTTPDVTDLLAQIKAYRKPINKGNKGAA
jgi:hypothetical protein